MARKTVKRKRVSPVLLAWIVYWSVMLLALFMDAKREFLIGIMIMAFVLLEATYLLTKHRELLNCRSYFAFLVSNLLLAVYVVFSFGIIALIKELFIKSFIVLAKPSNSYVVMVLVLVLMAKFLIYKYFVQEKM